ncbi:hypothetical protein CMI41_02690 [Candidatus Pacearchaeota archaeon]|nr:hypothetical protein [Candidatus Pacearchaeota archaeon]|tara:strand:+ start:13598 stop:14080 length:483 start_codon:yes stop_codon:yes gene_type:complete
MEEKLLPKDEVKEAIVRYMVVNATSLKDTMPNARAFLLRGRRVTEFENAPDEVVYGTVPDALAYSIEEGRFFGEETERIPLNAHFTENASLVPIVAGKQLRMTLEDYSFHHGGLWAPGKIVSENGYLDCLRAKSCFVKSARAMGLEEGVVNAALEIFSSD